jgi:hypothetical protein
MSYGMVRISLKILAHMFPTRKTCRSKFIKSARGTTQVHKKYTRENTQQDQEQEKRAQKSAKLEASKRVLTKIHSKRDLRKQSL